jgi:hypothetical protein
MSIKAHQGRRSNWLHHHEIDKSQSIQFGVSSAPTNDVARVYYMLATEALGFGDEDRVTEVDWSASFV